MFYSSIARRANSKKLHKKTKSICSYLIDITVQLNIGWLLFRWCNNTCTVKFLYSRYLSDLSKLSAMEDFYCVIIPREICFWDKKNQVFFHRDQSYIFGKTLGRIHPILRCTTSRNKTFFRIWLHVPVWMYSQYHFLFLLFAEMKFDEKTITMF